MSRHISYDGAWRLDGLAAETAYLDRTAFWVGVFDRSWRSRPYLAPT